MNVGDLSPVSANLFFTQLPNLRNESNASYFLFKKVSQTAIAFPPSPSDTSVTVFGVIEAPLEVLFDDKAYEPWERVSNKQVPSLLNGIAVEKDLYMSRNLNETFNENPYFKNGLLLKTSSAGRYYFLAVDMDHDIEY